jgi:hypothetical protein
VLERVDGELVFRQPENDAIIEAAFDDTQPQVSSARRISNCRRHATLLMARYSAANARKKRCLETDGGGNAADELVSPPQRRG